MLAKWLLLFSNEDRDQLFRQLIVLGFLLVLLAVRVRYQIRTSSYSRYFVYICQYG